MERSEFKALTVQPKQLDGFPCDIEKLEKVFSVSPCIRGGLLVRGATL
jgi:hypothetical protein